MVRFHSTRLDRAPEKVFSADPCYGPMPRRGKPNLNSLRRQPLAHYSLTLRHWYGTSIAPLRLFCAISTSFQKKGWAQLQCAPCVFRLCRDRGILGAVCHHVDDLLVGASCEGWRYIMDAVDSFNHTGAGSVREQNIGYLGIDVGSEEGAIFLGHQTYSETKLIPVPEARLSAMGLVTLSGGNR